MSSSKNHFEFAHLLIQLEIGSAKQLFSHCEVGDFRTAMTFSGNFLFASALSLSVQSGNLSRVRLNSPFGAVHPFMRSIERIPSLIGELCVELNRIYIHCYQQHMLQSLI